MLPCIQPLPTHHALRVRQRRMRRLRPGRPVRQLQKVKRAAPHAALVCQHIVQVYGRRKVHKVQQYEHFVQLVQRVHAVEGLVQLGGVVRRPLGLVRYVAAVAGPLLPRQAGVAGAVDRGGQVNGTLQRARVAKQRSSSRALGTPFGFRALQSFESTTLEIRADTAATPYCRANPAHTEKNIKRFQPTCSQMCFGQSRLNQAAAPVAAP